MTAPSNANTSGLSEIISDDEILRVHGHANFGSDMTPRDVVNEGVLKYAFGYCSGHTQLCILMKHGLITKPKPGRYDASLTKKGKRYARALGGYQNAVTAASAQAAIDEQEETIESLKRLVDQHYDRATAAEARADRLAKALETLEAERKREGVNLAHLKRAVAVAYADMNRAALQQEKQP